MNRMLRPLFAAAMFTLAGLSARAADNAPNPVTLDRDNFYEVVRHSTVPLVVLVTSKDCTACAKAEAEFAELASKHPEEKFAVVDLALLAGPSPTDSPIASLPIIQTYLPGQPILYVHTSVDKLPGGFTGTVEARAAMLQKVAPMFFEAAGIDRQIKANRQEYGDLDALRKPSDRALREDLNHELASLYERKAALINEMTPLLEDENDAGPAAE